MICLESKSLREEPDTIHHRMSFKRKMSNQSPIDSPEYHFLVFEFRPFPSLPGKIMLYIFFFFYFSQLKFFFIP